MNRSEPTIQTMKHEITAPYDCTRQNRNMLFLVYAMAYAAMGLIVMGCSDQQDYKSVDFSQTISVARPEQNDSDRTSFRVAVAAMISPKETLVCYQNLLNYIGKKLDRDVQFIQRKTYAEINELIRKGQVDLAFICTGPYASGRERYGFEALATPIVRGEPYYQSYLIVNRESPFQKFEDLRGRKFAFTDPQSNTGALIPTYWLNQIGETPDSYFQSVHFTYSHDNSILAVAKSLVDGATVDSHIWEFYNRQNPVHTSKTRVIKKSVPFGSPPFVAASSLPKELKTEVRDILLGLHNEEAGQKILDELLIDRFAPVQEEWYESVRVIKQGVYGAETPTIHTQKS
jgi:phosphate/phosphite/phosphonate ABC transporter binding protein